MGQLGSITPLKLANTSEFYNNSIVAAIEVVGIVVGVVRLKKKKKKNFLDKVLFGCGCVLAKSMDGIIGSDALRLARTFYLTRI